MKKFFQRYKLHFLIFIVSFGVYANTISHDYAWDDAIVITGNERVQKGLSDVPALLKNYKSEKVSDQYGYRPVTLLTFATEIEFFGLNPTVAHFNNVLLYAILCVLIYQFLLLFFGRNKWKFCLLIVLLYAVHPLHTEVVANIKSRDEIMAFIFGILAMLFLLKSISSVNGIKYLLLIIPCLILSFLSKESGLFLIPILFLIAYFKVSFSKTKFVQSSIIIGLSTLILLVIWKISQSDIILVDKSIELLYKGQFKENLFLTNPLFSLPRNEVIGSSMFLLIKYIKLFFIPYPLLHDYGYNQIPKVMGATPMLVFGFLLLVAYIVFLIRNVRKKSPLVFGSLFFFISIVGYLHLLLPGKDIFAERFMFVPSLGLCIVLILLLERIARKVKEDTLKVQAAFMIPLLLTFSILTINRNKAWANNGRLFETDIPYLQNCVRANFNYANYLESNSFTENQEKIIGLYKNCISISSRSYKAYINLGKLYMANEEYQKALSLFEEVAALNKELSEPYFLLGKYYLTIGDYQLALKNFKIAQNNGRTKTENYYQIAVCYIKLKKLQDAIEILEKGEKHQPDYYQYYDLLGDLYLINKDTLNAVRYTHLALKLAPNQETVLNKYKQRKGWIEN